MTTVFKHRRSQPGLRPQHLAGLRLIEQLASGTLEGGSVSSKAIVLQPGKLRCGDYLGDTGTAGSCTLLAQACHCLVMDTLGVDCDVQCYQRRPM